MATKVVQMTKEELSNLNDRLDRDVAFIGTALDRYRFLSQNADLSIIQVS